MSRKNQRQLKYSRLETILVKNRKRETDSEGVTSETFPGEGFTVRGEVWPAAGKRQAELYGERIYNISNVRIAGQYQLSLDQNGAFVLTLPGGDKIGLGDGVYIYADPASDPDYRVISITPYQPVKMEIERR